MCTYKVSLSLLLLLHFFHHLCDSLQLSVHQLLLQLLVLEHCVYVLQGCVGGGYRVTLDIRLCCDQRVLR